ncbi:MAG: hypothetical protein WD717_03825 [Nitrosarchaeum sp.]
MSLPYSQAMTSYLQNYLSKGQLKIIKTVDDEVGSAIWNEATQQGKKLGFSAKQVRYLATLAIQRFQKLRNGIIIDDDISKALEVRKMYYGIWKDSTKISKISNWAIAKNMQSSDGPPQGSDEIILSTVASIANSKSTELLTFDHDFLIFKDEIKQNFCVDVMDASTIYI